MNPLGKFAAIRHPGTLSALLITFLVSLQPIPTHAQQLYDFTALAADAARAVEKASNGMEHPVVLVTDFSEESHPDSELGIALARDFANALRARAKGVIVLDRSDVEAAISSHKLPEGALNSPGITGCYAPELEATVTIGARIKYTPGKMVFKLDVWAVRGDRGIFGKQTVIDLTSEMEALTAQPAAKVDGSFGEDKTEWAKDEESRTKTIPPNSGTQGYSYPSCLRCRPAPYSDAAVKAKVQGTVILKVVIGANGRAEKISVQQALPCGLDQQAINAVKQWDFKPATGPDGGPATVLQTVEVAFRLY